MSNADDFPGTASALLEIWERAKARHSAAPFSDSGDEVAALRAKGDALAARVVELEAGEVQTVRTLARTLRDIARGKEHDGAGTRVGMFMAADLLDASVAEEGPTVGKLPDDASVPDEDGPAS